MKIKVVRESFSAAFGLVGSFVPSKTPKEILRNVKVIAKGGTCVLMGTDLESGIRMEISGVEILQEGEALLKKDIVGAIVRESLAEFVTIDVTDSGIEIVTDASDFNLPTEDPKEYPTVKPFESEKYFELSSSLLREMVRRTIFATDKDSTRYALGGVFFELGKESDVVTSVGTDGRRLSVQSGVGTSHGDFKSDGIVVNSRGAALIERMISGSDCMVKVFADHGSFYVDNGKCTIMTSLVEGRFPAWRNVVPNYGEGSMKVDVLPLALLSGIRQAAVVSDVESRGVDHKFEDGKIRIGSATKDIGKSRIDVDVKVENFSPALIRVDHRYVEDFLRVCPPTSEVSLTVKDGCPITMRTSDGYLYVVMPMATPT